MDDYSWARLSKECEYWGEHSAPDKEQEAVERKKKEHSLPTKQLLNNAIGPEDPKQKLPFTEDDGEGNCSIVEQLAPQNEIVRHTIHLQKHAKIMMNLLSSAESNSGSDTDFTKFPPVPVMVKTETPSARARAMDQDGSPAPNLNFVLGQGPKLQCLSPENINYCLEKSVITLLAHAGFDKSHKSCIDVLSDVLRETLSKICNLLHVLSQKDQLRGRVYYNDTLEKAFQMLGLSGVRSIDEYYRKEIIDKQKEALKRSTNLTNLYKNFVKIKTQTPMEIVDTNVPEIHFPAFVGVNSLHSSLEPGLQMLDMLDEQQQS